MNTRLHAVTERASTELLHDRSQISDYTGAAALLDSLLTAEWMLADRGYDADWSREALEEKGIKIMFGRFKDWRRVATRYDRCPTVSLSAICLAATVMFWL